MAFIREQKLPQYPFFKKKKKDIRYVPNNVSNRIHSLFIQIISRLHTPSLLYQATKMVQFTTIAKIGNKKGKTRGTFPMLHRGLLHIDKFLWATEKIFHKNLEKCNHICK